MLQPFRHPVRLYLHQILTKQEVLWSSRVRVLNEAARRLLWDDTEDCCAETAARPAK